MPPNENAVSLRVAIPAEFSFVAFEDDICVAYARRHLLRNGCVEVACDIVQRAGLTDGALEPGLDLLRNAILSLSTTFYGNQNRQKSIANRGYQLYGKVLAQLNTHLAQPHRQTTDETILTAVTCMIMEMFVPTGSNSFFKHVRGIEAIIAARGPPTDQRGVNPAMISGVRILCIVGAIVERRPSIWGKGGWKNIPPPHDDEGSVIRHEILHILADCTILMQDMDKVLSNATTQEDRRRALAFALGCMGALQALHPRWERHNANMLDSDAPFQMRDPMVTSHASATTYMLYNTAYICILRILQAYDPSRISLSLQVSASMRIIRCLELKADRKHEGSGESNTIAFIATKVAWQTLGGSTTPAGSKLSHIVKGATKGFFAADAWDGPEDFTEQQTLPLPFQGIDATMPLAQVEQIPLVKAGYRAIDLVNVGEKPPSDIAPLWATSETPLIYAG